MSDARTEFVTVARVGDVPEGGVKTVRIGDQELAVFLVDGAYHVIEDVCTHDGGPLAEGTLEGPVVECPRHGARFDVRTGAVLSPPAVVAIQRFEVRVAGDQIQVAWPVSDRDAARPAPAPASAGTQSAPPPAAAPATTGATAPSQAPSQQELAVRSALETVMDPEIGLSVIDLGLIREVAIADGKTHIKMLLTTPFCPYAPQMIAEVKSAAQSVLPQDCEVEVLPDPWSPEMMPDPGLLGFSY